MYVCMHACIDRANRDRWRMGDGQKEKKIERGRERMIDDREIEIEIDR